VLEVIVLADPLTFVGDASDQATQKFPGNGSGLTEAQIQTLNTEAGCAVDAEALFDSSIAAASGATAAALQVGKMKNKVLKLTGMLHNVGC
jgi:hypothetical protein